MVKNFKEALKERQDYINHVLDVYLPETEGRQKTVLEAMKYSVLIGGKRIRPILLLEMFRCFAAEEEEEERIEPFLAAMEFLHTYSLVHDDLPDMDNDRYRRGQLTTHAKFGPAMGILAGDALLNYAFETACKAFSITDEEWDFKVAKALKVFATKAGVYGMIGGQVVDVEKTGQPLDTEDISFVYELKTCALLESSMLIGAILGGADDALFREIVWMASCIGMAFQIQDDILDTIGDEQKLGKPVGSDAKNEKMTYVTLHGIEAAKEKVKELSAEALQTAEKLSCTEFMKELIVYLTIREY